MLHYHFFLISDFYYSSYAFFRKTVVTLRRQLLDQRKKIRIVLLRSYSKYVSDW